MIIDHPEHPDRYKETKYWKDGDEYFCQHLPDGVPKKVTKHDFEYWSK